MLEDLPGTGRTFILSAFAERYNTSIDYLVFRKDQAAQLVLNKIEAYTSVSYNMRHFTLQYHIATNIFDMHGKNNIDVLHKLIQYSLKFTNVQERCTVKTIILDTYTVYSPIMLLLLYVMSLKNGTNLIFSGSKIQMGTLRKSQLHNRSNFYIAQILSDFNITQLTKNMRSRDENFVSKLSHFCEAIECCKPEGEVPFHFGLRYMLYCLFQPKYFTEERFDTLYMSQYHLDITRRLHCIIDNLKLNNVPYRIEPYQYWYEENYFVIPMDNRDRKFFPGLLLVNGYKYVYITKEGRHRIVQLEEMIFEDNHVHTLRIRYMDDDRVEKIQRCCLNYYQILPAYRTWLLSQRFPPQFSPNISDDRILFHFPLRAYALTFHAALGQTIKDTVEISVDYSYPMSTANCIYAGFSSLSSDSIINKIHAGRDLLGFIVTNYMEIERNDKEFYYRCPENAKNRNEILQYGFTKMSINECIDKIQWIDVDSILRFESKKETGYLRIPRNIFEQNMRKEKTTPLMKVAQFMKENPRVILNTISTALKEKLSFDNRKKKPKSNIKPNSKESESYIYLQQAYNEWDKKDKK